MGSSPSKGDKQDDSHSTKQSNNDHHHHMMPLFRKQSGSAKKKLQHKQYLVSRDVKNVNKNVHAFLAKYGCFDSIREIDINVAILL